MRKLLILLGMTALLGLFASVTPAQADPAIPFSNDKTEQIVGSGSDTIYFLMKALSDVYNESDGCIQVAPIYPTPGASPNQSTCLAPASQPAGIAKGDNYDHEVAYNLFPVGSNGGKRQLCEQTNPRPSDVVYVSFARSSAAPGNGFQCPGTSHPGGPLTLRYVAFAKDGLTWVYWNGQAPAPVTDLTASQLGDIFVDCTITNWNQIGGENATIEVWTAISGSGTRSSWDAFVGGNSTSCIPAIFKDGNLVNGERIIREHQNQPVETENRNADGTPAVAPFDDEQYSIYYGSVGVHNADPAAKQNGLHGWVEGWEPNETNIVSGDFPFSRFMYNVIRQTGPAPLVSPATAGFVGGSGWICKPAAQHSKPTGDPGPGTPADLANKNWNNEMLAAMASEGFFPIRTVGNKCDVTDWLAP